MIDSNLKAKRHAEMRSKIHKLLHRYYYPKTRK